MPALIDSRPKGSLLLDLNAQRVAELWCTLPSVNAIHQRLKTEGIGVCLRTLQEWCRAQVKINYLPRRDRSDRRGRPPRRRPKSFGFLDRVARGDDAWEILHALSLLFHWTYRPDDLPLKTALGPDGLDLVIKRDGEPDYRESAVEFGRFRVESFGDLDYFLMAMWSSKLRSIRPANRSEANDLCRQALELAVTIRAEMLATVQGRNGPV